MVVSTALKTKVIDNVVVNYDDEYIYGRSSNKNGIHYIYFYSRDTGDMIIHIRIIAARKEGEAR